MTTPTTLKLTPELKARIVPLAAAAAKTAHAWMVDALEAQVASMEQRERFLADAQQALEEIYAGGPRYAAGDVNSYLVALARGRKAPRPKAVKQQAVNPQRPARPQSRRS